MEAWTSWPVVKESSSILVSAEACRRLQFLAVAATAAATRTAAAVDDARFALR